MVNFRRAENTYNNEPTGNLDQKSISDGKVSVFGLQNDKQEWDRP